MAKPAHTRVTWSGVVGSGAAPVEHWSFSLNFDAGVIGADTTDAELNAFGGQLLNAWSFELGPSMPEDVVLTETRIAAIGADGKVTRRGDGSYIQGVKAQNYPGEQAKQPMPPQIALCVSLGTARPGPTGKGRFFLPWPALSLDATDKRVPVAQINGFIDNVVRFIERMDDPANIGQPMVVSSKGYTSPVTSIRIGRAPDTLRSRREDVAEGYVSAALDFA